MLNTLKVKLFKSANVDDLNAEIDKFLINKELVNVDTKYLDDVIVVTVVYYNR